jgi:hypothetical protein
MIVDEVLTGKVWNNEDETRWTVEITERIKQACKGLYQLLPFFMPRYRILDPQSLHFGATNTLSR